MSPLGGLYVEVKEELDTCPIPDSFFECAEV